MGTVTGYAAVPYMVFVVPDQGNPAGDFRRVNLGDLKMYSMHVDSRRVRPGEERYGVWVRGDGAVLMGLGRVEGVVFDAQVALVDL